MFEYHEIKRNKIIDYKVVTSNSLSILERRVKYEIAEGWQPLGAPYYEIINPATLNQALVKYGE